MNKQEMIDKYGIEWYNRQKQIRNERCKERYKNDKEYRERKDSYKRNRYKNDEEYRNKELNRRKELYKNDLKFRETQKVNGQIYNISRYVKDGKYELIENYELAKVDNFKGWEVHHRLELHYDYSLRFTRESLLKLNLYYNRPPEELIWMKVKEHRSIHRQSQVIARNEDTFDYAIYDHD